MPQLDPSSFLSQLFWLAAVFTLLYFIMARATLPQISRVLQNRQTRIRGDLDKAESLRKEAERVAREYEEAQVETRTKAASIIKSAQDKAEEEAARKREELDKVIQKKLMDADRKMADTRKKVIEEIQPAAAELAALVVKNITGQGVGGGKTKAKLGSVSKEGMND